MCRVFPLATNPVRVKAPSVRRRPSTNSVFNTAIASFNNTYFSCVYDESPGRQLKEEDAASQGVGLDSNSAAEIKTLAIEDKWFADLRIANEGEVERLTQRLAGRVKELEERYAQPLLELEQEVEAFSVKVEGHLKKMRVVWA